MCLLVQCGHHIQTAHYKLSAVRSNMLGVLLCAQWPEDTVVISERQGHRVL